MNSILEGACNHSCIDYYFDESHSQLLIRLLEPLGQQIITMTMTSAKTATGNTDFSSMSVKQLRAYLTQAGVDASAFLEKYELIAAARKVEQTNFDDEAHKIFAQLNLQPSTANQYANLDAIWRHPTGGGTVYVGNYVAASDRLTLDERNITAVVNCQGLDSQNYFEGDPKITYHRFPVATLSHSRLSGFMAGKQKALKGMTPTFDFLDEQTAKGQSVLVHCLAGAHRAGTVGVAYLMYKTGMGVDQAIATAKKCRPIIGPFATLLALLRYLEKDLQLQAQEEEEEEVHV